MNIPYKCPACKEKLRVTKLTCSECSTIIQGEFNLPDIINLEKEEENFVKAFLSARGNIKEVEKNLGISYPTVKSRLENILKKMGLSLSDNGKKRRSEIIAELENGTIDAKQAIKELKNLEGK